MLWSDQNIDRFGFKYHVDGDSPLSWSVDEVPASQSALNIGSGMADDHLNFAVASDGTIYAAVKTSYDQSGYPQMALLIRRPGGTWDNLYEISQGGTRRIVILNESINKVRVVYTSSDSGGDIVYKESPTSSISFGSEMTLISGTYNNSTTSKQNQNGEMVVMASSSSSLVSVLVSDAAPLSCVVPVGLSASNITSTSAQINWSGSVVSDTFLVRYQLNGAGPFLYKTVNGSGGTTNAILIGLNPSSLYTYQVSSICNGVSSGYGTGENFTTLTGTVSCGIPSGGSSSSITSTTAIISRTNTDTEDTISLR